MFSGGFQSVKKRRLIALVLLALLAAIGSVVQFNQTFQAPCRLEAAAVWTAANSGQGQITAYWERNRLSWKSDRVVYQFERPDIININLYNAIVSGAIVKAGDTLAVLSSREGIARIDEYNAELSRAKAEKKALLTGSRVEDREVIRKELEKIETEIKVYRPDYKRIKALYDSNLISLDRYQEAEGKMLVYEAELELARARLKSSEAGAKPEKIMVADENIKKWRRQVENARVSLDKIEYIIAPADGRIKLGLENEPDVILKLEYLDTLAVNIYIAESYFPSIEIKTDTKISLSALPEYVFNVSLENYQLFIQDLRNAGISSLIANDSGKLQAGMTGTARIPIGRLTLWNGIKKQLGLRNIIVSN